MGTEQSELGLSAKLDGTWVGRVPGIIKVTVSLSGSDSANLDVSVIGQKDIKCTETITETDSLISFPDGPNTGDCLGDSLRGQKKDPTKYTLIKNSDGSLSFTSDGYPTLKLTEQSELGLSAKLDGTWVGRVPGIIKVTVSLSGSDSANLDVSVIGQKDIKCTETITETDSLISFPDGPNTGDCLGDSLR